MSHVMLITGSLRQDSYNTKLLGHLESLLPWDFTVDFLGNDALSLPLFNEDLEHESQLRMECVNIHARFARAQGFLIATPEYNGLVSAYLKNTIDWISRLSYIDESKVNPFLDKPTLLCSVSTGHRGGSHATSNARDLLSYVGANAIGGSICINHAAEKFDQEHINFSESESAEVGFHMNRWLNTIEAFSAKGQ
jgi:NAD(P)H-dependent FMN reductase